MATPAKRPAPSQDATAAPPPLSFPRPIFAALSPHPFLRAHLTTTSAPKQKNGKSQPPLRANNRTPTESRVPQVHTGSLTHCNGSAVVRLGNTVAVCGIRAEILKAEADVEAPSSTEEDEDLDNDDVRDLSLLVPNFELSTGSTPLLLPGNAPSAFAQTLTTRIRNLLLSTKLIRARDLRILYSPSTTLDSEMADSAEGTDPSAQIQSGGIGDEQQVLVKGYWVLYIDTLFVSLDGNAFDAAWLGILAALRDTKLPRAFFDEEYEDILCSDSPSEARKSDLRGLPVPSTFAVFEGGEGGEEARDWVLTDPDAFEESVCKESVCVVVDCESGDGDAMIRKVEKSGGGVVDRVLLRGLVERARERWGVWRDVLSKVG